MSFCKFCSVRIDKVSPMSASLKIAIVEDHDDLRDLFVDFLREQSHDVAGFCCADDLDEHLAGEDVDLLILDLNLPGEDGYSIAQRLRSVHNDLHIIMVTARTAIEERIKGYACGADLYLSKPVSPAELNAAVGSVARRVHDKINWRTTLMLDTVRLLLSSNQAEVAINKMDALLLKSLAEAPGCRLEYWRLMELLNLEQNDKGKRALEVRFSRLKKKMAEAGAPEPSIKSLWKTGYQLCTVLRIDA